MRFSRGGRCGQTQGGAGLLHAHRGGGGDAWADSSFAGDRCRWQHCSRPVQMCTCMPDALLSVREYRNMACKRPGCQLSHGADQTQRPAVSPLSTEVIAAQTLFRFVCRRLWCPCMTSHLDPPMYDSESSAAAY